MTHMTPALARLVVSQQEDTARPDRRTARKQRKAASTARVKVPQQRTGVRLPPR